MCEQYKLAVYVVLLFFIIISFYVFIFFPDATVP